MSTKKPRPLILRDDYTQEVAMQLLFNRDGNKRKYPFRVLVSPNFQDTNFSRADIQRIQRWFGKALKSLS